MAPEYVPQVALRLVPDVDARAVGVLRPACGPELASARGATLGILLLCADVDIGGVCPLPAKTWNVLGEIELKPGRRCFEGNLLAFVVALVRNGKVDFRGIADDMVGVRDAIRAAEVKIRKAVVIQVGDGCGDNSPDVVQRRGLAPAQPASRITLPRRVAPRAARARSAPARREKTAQSAPRSCSTESAAGCAPPAARHSTRPAWR